jgi:ribosome biogenesis GTPase
MQGKIIKNISNDYTVLSNNQTYICKSRGKFRNMHITPLVGDNVLFDDDNKYIMEILTRKNELVRPPVSNVDQAIIITSMKKPDFSTNLLDKLLVIIEFNNIKPVICFTKLDLLNADELSEYSKYFDYYKSIGYEVFFNNNIESLQGIFKDKISVLTGQSGSGKSSLINKLDSNFNLKTDEISLALGRGKHTTRHTELIEVCDGYVADTPGFSAISFEGMEKSDIRDNFIEFNSYRHLCKYKDCMHNNESDCEIKNKVDDGTIIKSRYENYIKFITSR